jgi:hypothetical protein
MAWLLLTVTAVLAVLVGALAVLVVRLQRRLAGVESQLAAPPASNDQGTTPFPVENLPSGSLDASPATEFVITRVGEPEVEEPVEPVPTVPAPVFADLLLKETVVQTASLWHGLRRALAPETRNRIRFHMRQEVKRSRKQRRAELREVRREWAARQRAAMAAEEGSAA